MSTSQMIVIALALVAGVVAGLGVLYRMAMEQARLWKRYVEVKMQLQRDHAIRERQQQEQKKVAKSVGSIGVPSGDDENLPFVGSGGAV